MYPSSDNGRGMPLMKVLVIAEFSLVTHKPLDAVAKVHKFFIIRTRADRRSARCSRTRGLFKHVYLGVNVFSSQRNLVLREQSKQARD
jgi:hypothetical protein